MVSKKDVGYFEKWTERLENIQRGGEMNRKRV